MTTRSAPRVGRVLVDSSAYFAFADPRDGNYGKATAIATQLAKDQAHLFTTTFVVAETYSLLLSRLGRATAIRVLDQIDQGTTTVIRVSLRDERRGREILHHYDDKNFSLVDATSFAIMERLRITHVFAFDTHFEQFGFRILQSRT